MKRFGSFFKKSFRRETDVAASAGCIRSLHRANRRFERRAESPVSLKVSFQKPLQFDVSISRIPVDKNKSGPAAWLILLFVALLGACVFTGCNFAPSYKRPATPNPGAFKELTPVTEKQVDGWKTAQPNDTALRGKWWEMFNDPQLNALEEQVDITNQTVAAALDNFLAARAIVKQNRAQYFPGITADPSVTRSRQAARSGSSGSSPAVRVAKPLRSRRFRFRSMRRGSPIFGGAFATRFAPASTRPRRRWRIWKTRD